MFPKRPVIKRFGQDFLTGPYFIVHVFLIINIFGLLFFKQWLYPRVLNILTISCTYVIDKKDFLLFRPLFPALSTFPLIIYQASSLALSVAQAPLQSLFSSFSCNYYFKYESNASPLSTLDLYRMKNCYGQASIRENSATRKCRK